MVKRKQIWISVAICALLFPVLFAQIRDLGSKTGKDDAVQSGSVEEKYGIPSSFSFSDEYRLVERAVDGDTLLLDGGERIRLIGIDTPETVHPTKPVQFFGKEASAFTKKMTQGKRVRLEYDWQKQDKYGRTLAYVYLPDGTFLNAEIVKQGYGHAYTRFPFKYIDEFREYEKAARENKRGLWADR